MDDHNITKKTLLAGKTVLSSNLLILNTSYDYDQLSLIDYLLERHYSISITTEEHEMKSVLLKNQYDLFLIITKHVDAKCLNSVRFITSNEKTKNIPIFIVGGYSNKMDKVIAFNAGIKDFIEYEAHPAEIVRRIKVHLDYYRSQQELEEELKNTDITFTLVAHDLKGPLSYILNMSKMLDTDEDLLESKEKKTILNMIFMATQKLHLLLTNLLEWRNVNKKRPFFKPIKLNLHKLVAININMLEVIYKSKNLSIKNLIRPGTEINADELMLNSIVRNLLFNAIKFSEDEGQITIEAEKLGNATKFSISDVGIGMTNEQVSNLFSESHKTITPGTKNEPGTGIGLKLCKEFIEKHGGDIWAESNITKGTKIHFVIPDVQY